MTHSLQAFPGQLFRGHTAVPPSRAHDAFYAQRRGLPGSLRVPLSGQTLSLYTHTSGDKIGVYVLGHAMESPPSQWRFTVMNPRVQTSPLQGHLPVSAFGPGPSLQVRPRHRSRTNGCASLFPVPFSPGFYDESFSSYLASHTLRPFSTFAPHLLVETRNTTTRLFTFSVVVETRTRHSTVYY